MDRITSIETKIKDLLLTIQIPTSASPVDYNNYTSTGTVNIEDEVLSLDQNTNNKMVNYVIYLSDNGEQGLETSLGQNAFTNLIEFRIVGKVHNQGDEGNPRFTINQRMNEVVSDFKKLFGEHFDLDGLCLWCKYGRSTREYSDDGNRIMSAWITMYLSVMYSQSIKNPDLPACI